MYRSILIVCGGHGILRQGSMCKWLKPGLTPPLQELGPGWVSVVVPLWVHLQLPGVLGYFVELFEFRERRVNKNLPLFLRSNRGDEMVVEQTC